MNHVIEERQSRSEDELRPLVERARARDPRAIEQLYLEHFDRIYSYLAMSVGNRHDAEDLTVQTFVRMIESIDRFQWQSVPFSAWLFRIARNLAIDHFRSTNRFQPEAEVPEPQGQEEPSAEEHAMRSFGRRSMLKMIGSLPPEQRQVLILKFLFSFANAEVAVVIGKTEGAVKALQHRALTSLQRLALPYAA
jgi:RNA polymerase sigma-70 factor (ECF subfamily)